MYSIVVASGQKRSQTKNQNEDEKEEAPAPNCHNSISMADNVSDFEWLFSHLRVMCHSVMVDVTTQAKRMEHTRARPTHSSLQLFKNSIENTLVYYTTTIL